MFARQNYEYFVPNALYIFFKAMCGNAADVDREDAKKSWKMGDPN